MEVLQGKETACSMSISKLSESLSALVIQGCYNRVPPTGGFRKSDLLSHYPGGWSSEMKVSEGCASPAGARKESDPGLSPEPWCFLGL